jgi:hypothetical protein
MGELLVVRRDKSEHTILFDDVDYDLLVGQRWHISGCRSRNTLYAQSVRGQLMHNLLLGVLGVDHINRNGLDNRRCNLRSAGQALNAANRAPNRGSSSVYKGVRFHAQSGKWRATIQVRGEQRSLGLYLLEWDAAQAYNAAAIKSWGEFAYLNVQVNEL